MINSRLNSGDDNSDQSRHPPKDNPVPAEQKLRVHDFFLHCGVRAERRGELLSALEQYQHALEIDPDSAIAWYNYGDVLLALHREEEALAPLRKAAELSPHDALIHYDLGLTLYNLGRYEEAQTEFAVIAAVDPKLQRAPSTLVLSSIINLALAQERLGDPTQAAATLSPAKEMAVKILFNLGMFKHLAKQAADAWPYAEAAATLDPMTEDAVHLAGTVLLELKREPEAIAYLRRATKLNPKCVTAWNDLGLAWIRLKKLEQARRCFQKALRLDANYEYAYYNLACLDSLAGKTSTAFRNLDKAVAHGFNDGTYLRQDSALRSLRRDKRWKRLLQSIGGEK